MRGYMKKLVAVCFIAVVEGTTIGRNDEESITLLSLSLFLLSLELNCLTTFNTPKTKNKQQTNNNPNIR